MKLLIAGAFSILLLASCTEKMNKNSTITDGISVTGAWKLVQSEQETGDSTIVRTPYRGIYLFTDSYYSIEIAPRDRPSLTETVPGAGFDRAEISAAEAGFISNSGTYEIKGDSLIYYVLVSKFPNRMNENERVASHITIEQDRFILRNTDANGTARTILERLK